MPGIDEGEQPTANQPASHQRHELIESRAIDMAQPEAGEDTVD
jgi:hypothetical protein